MTGRRRLLVAGVGAVWMSGCGVYLGNAPPAPSASRASTVPSSSRTSAANATSSPSASLSASPSSSPVRISTSTTAAQPGYLGVEVGNPPQDWTVTGCEILNVYQGTPAAQAGLVGAHNRLDPVGDVIASLTYPGGNTVPVANCGDLQQALSSTYPGERVTLQYFHRVVRMFIGHWVRRLVEVTLASPPCPSPVTGRITSNSTGNRLRLTVAVKGPSAIQAFSAILDTGADGNIVPNQIMQETGYQPVGTTYLSGVVAGASTLAYVYRIPGQDLLLLDQGRYVPLASGMLTIYGMPQVNISPLIGPEILKQGTQLETTGSSWTLIPPCGP